MQAGHRTLGGGRLMRRRHAFARAAPPHRPPHRPPHLQSLDRHRAACLLPHRLIRALHILLVHRLHGGQLVGWLR